jgi:hypothetical protein
MSRVIAVKQIINTAERRAANLKIICFISFSHPIDLLE